MQDNVDNLSPDLEWMLQSEQVSQDTLVEHLTREYYPRIYQQCRDQLVYPEEARRAARETFISACLLAKDYRNDRSIGDWLARLAGDICKVHLADIENQSFLNPRLIQSILRRWPPKAPNSRAVERSIEEILFQVQDRRTSRLKRSGLYELVIAVAAVVILLGALVVASGSFDTALSVGTTVAETDLSRAFSSGTATAQSPASSAAEVFTLSARSHGLNLPPLVPLDLQSSHEDIWRRLLLSRFLWDTLWADVWLILRGPEAYRGPPLMERHQVWIDQENKAFHLSGPARGKPIVAEVVIPTTSGPAPASFLDGVADYARLGSQFPWYFLSNDLLFSSPYLINFYLINFDSFPPTNLQFEAVGEEYWIGRQTVVVQAKDTDGNLLARLWLDNQIGITLRAQYFDPTSPGEAAFETSVARLDLDWEFPEEIIDLDEESLLKLGFALDYSGEPEPSGIHPIIPPTQALTRYSRLLPTSPPADLDLSENQLTFQPSALSPIQSTLSYDGKITVKVLGDQYHVRRVLFTDPLRLICDRSPDGFRFAYTEWPGSQEAATHTVNWFDLAGEDIVEYALPETLVVRLSFAPDSRRLAVVGIDENDTRGRLYVIDTQTGDSILLSEAEQMWGLAWSPDGVQLAALKSPGTSVVGGNSLLVRVINLNNLTAVNRRVDEYSRGETTLEVPLEGWTAEFQLPMLGLDNCASPP